MFSDPSLEVDDEEDDMARLLLEMTTVACGVMDVEAAAVILLLVVAITPAAVGPEMALKADAVEVDAAWFFKLINSSSCSGTGVRS